jgi:hypothetical protein
MDADDVAGRAASARTAKTCGSGTSTLVSSVRRCLRIAQTTVTKKPEHREEHGAAVKTIAQGRLGIFG